MDLEALNSGQPGVLLLLKVFFPTSVTIHFISAGEFFTRSHKSNLTGIASGDFLTRFFWGVMKRSVSPPEANAAL